MKKVNDLALIEDYNKGMIWENLQEKYSCSVTTVYDVLIRNGIKRKRNLNRKWSTKKQELFKQMYLSNCTYKEIGKAFNLKNSSITWQVHNMHLPMRGSGRNNTIDNKFAEHTAVSNYWLGYFFADGHLSYSDTQRNYRVSLYSEKQYVVEKYKEWLGESVKIYTRTYTSQDGIVHTMYNASIHSKEIAYWFRNTLNISSKKHHNLNPTITLNWDIVRGYFDGDGSCGHYQWQLKSSSKIWLERIQTFMASYRIKSSIRLSSKDCYGLYVYGKTNLSLLLKNLYSNTYYCHDYKYKNLVNLTSAMAYSKSGELLEA